MADRMHGPRRRVHEAALVKSLPALAGPVPPPPPGLLEQARKDAAGAYAANTTRKYRECWRTFRDWCLVIGRPSLPASPETVALFVGWLSGSATQEPIIDTPGALHGNDLERMAEITRRRPKAWATVSLHLTAIEKMHHTERSASPFTDEGLRHVIRGTMNRLGKASKLARRPLLPDDLRKLVKKARGSKLARTLQRAVILVGFSAALRRSELVGLDVDDLSIDETGATLRITKSKTDQAGVGDFVKILKATKESNFSICPLRALKRWLDRSGVKEGPLFRLVLGDVVVDDRLDAQHVSFIIKRLCRRIGYDPSRYGGHSLRAGFITTAAKRGVEAWKIARTSRHKNINTLMRYIREHDLDKNNPAEGLL